MCVIFMRTPDFVIPVLAPRVDASNKDVIAVAVFGLRLAKPILAVIILDSFVGLPLDVAGNAFLAEILVGAAVLYGLWALVGKP